MERNVRYFMTAIVQQRSSPVDQRSNSVDRRGAVLRVLRIKNRRQLPPVT
jgi:hypothetical protein